MSVVSGIADSFTIQAQSQLGFIGDSVAHKRAVVKLAGELQTAAQKQATAKNRIDVVAGKATLKAQKITDRITSQINNFTRTLIVKTNRSVTPGGVRVNILNPARQAQLNNLQLQFQHKIAKEGGNYQPIPLDSISPTLAAAENAAALYAPAPPGQTATTTVTTGVGSVTANNPTGIGTVQVPTGQTITGTTADPAATSYYSAPSSAGGGGGVNPGLDSGGGASTTIPAGGLDNTTLLLIGAAVIGGILLLKRK